MKNVLIYTNPDKEFNEENKTLVKIHIDNSLELGWKRENILLFTNFAYEHNGIRSIPVPDRLHLKWDKTSNKILVIDYLLKNKILTKDLYWYHDFDCYQNNYIGEEELQLDGYDLGITGYGYKPQANGGSFFFRETATDLFDLWVSETIRIKRTRADEKTMTDMVRAKKITRYKWLNITYNFGMRHTEYNYARATKPLKALHFHPDYNDAMLPFPTKDCFMYGKNPMGFPLMSPRLIRLFRKHGIN